MKITKLVYQRFEDGSREWRMCFEGVAEAMRIQRKQAKHLVKYFKKGYCQHNAKTDDLIYIEYLPIIVN